MDNGKTPGLDGLPAELYKMYWRVIGSDLVDAYNHMVSVRADTGEHGMHRMKEGAITLIHKKGDKDLMKNYRPITMLSVIYKLLASVLTNRMTPHMQHIIHPDQTGFMKGRQISSNIRIALDVVARAKQKQWAGALLMLDWEKAYDVVDWGWLDKCLRRADWFVGANVSSVSATQVCMLIRSPD